MARRDRGDYYFGPEPRRENHSGAIAFLAVAALATFAGATAFRPEVTELYEALKGDDPAAAQAPNPEIIAPTTTVPAAAPVEAIPTTGTLSYVDEARFGTRAQWWTDTASGHTMQVLDGKYPVVYTNFDKQWIYPPGEKGGRCGEGTYASGIAYELGRFVSPVEIWTNLQNAGGHDPNTGSGMLADRAKVAEMYGLENHEFNSLQEAEDYARNVNPDIYVIIAEDNPGDSSFSIDGKHIVGLFWVPEEGGWRGGDPNDYYRTGPGQARDPDLQDNLKTWYTPEAKGLYNVQGWTNPAGRQRGPWETAP